MSDAFVQPSSSLELLASMLAGALIASLLLVVVAMAIGCASRWARRRRARGGPTVNVRPPAAFRSPDTR